MGGGRGVGVEGHGAALGCHVEEAACRDVEEGLMEEEGRLLRASLSVSWASSHIFKSSVVLHIWYMYMYVRAILTYRIYHGIHVLSFLATRQAHRWW